MSKTTWQRKTSSTIMTFLAAAFLLSGCATTPVQSLSIDVSNNGVISINGQNTSLSNIGRAAKRAGARQGTMIKVKVPARSFQNLSQSIKQNLAKAGLPNIFFVKGSTSSAFVNKDNEKAKLKKPKPTTPRMRRTY